MLHFCNARAHDNPQSRAPCKVPKRKTTSLNLDRDSGLWVGNLNTELLRACNNLNSLSRRNGVRNPVCC